MPEAEPLTFALPAPLTYQREVVAFLKESEPELWQWASSPEAKSAASNDVSTSLLKSSYRLDADGHPDLTARCGEVARKLGVTVPVTLYQGSGGLGQNASICCLPGAVHIVFTGPILSTLKGAELDAVLGHELAHHCLWEIDQGAFLTADRLLLTAASDPRASASHMHTARRFRLYTEIFADRGALAGCGDLHATVAALVKTETGLPEVSPASYLRQADEIFSREGPVADGVDHPETFIRARALRLWAENAPGIDDWLAGVIEGPLLLDELDFTGQRQIAMLTRRFLAELLRPRWFQSMLSLAHARLFFPDFTPASSPDEGIAAELITHDDAMREYLCYVLLDFAAVDRELEDAPLAAAIQWSHRLEMAAPFEKIALKELGIGKRQFNKVKKEAVTILANAEVKE